MSERGDTGIDAREASSPGKGNGSWQDADGDNLSVIQRQTVVDSDTLSETLTQSH